jgi:CBS domain containing-hemolysin-like protein
MSMGLSGTASEGSGGIANERVVGPVAVAIALGAVAVASFAGSGGNGGAGPFAICAVVALAVGALVFGRVVPRAKAGDRPGRTALILAVVSVLALAAFWSGVPQVLAPAAILLGLTAPRNGESTAAVVLGSVAYVLSLVGVFVG